MKDNGIFYLMVEVFKSMKIQYGITNSKLKKVKNDFIYYDN